MSVNLESCFKNFCSPGTDIQIFTFKLEARHISKFEKKGMIFSKKCKNS